MLFLTVVAGGFCGFANGYRHVWYYEPISATAKGYFDSLV
jgi:hypothetical protein